jgi:3-deoxy-7-phosphoheptulonate synthase
MVTEVQQRLEDAGLPSGILVDCSHANSEKDYMRQSIAFRDVVKQRVDGNEGLVGLMVESHLNPGNQKLGDDPAKLEYGVSITDACIGWDETEELLTEAYSQLHVQQPVS